MLVEVEVSKRSSLGSRAGGALGLALQACVVLVLIAGCSFLSSDQYSIGGDALGNPGLDRSIDTAGVAAMGNPYTSFAFPTAGMLGWTYGRIDPNTGKSHGGIDVWTGFACGNGAWLPQPGNAVYLAYSGKLVYWVFSGSSGPNQVKKYADGRGVCVGLIFEHVDPLPDSAHPTWKLYTFYLHLAISSTGQTTVDPRFLNQSAWGVSYAKGTYLGRQGDKPYAVGESTIQHLHFAVFRNGDGVLREKDYIDPSPYLGLVVRYGAAGCLPSGSQFEERLGGGATYVSPVLRPAAATIAAAGGSVKFTAVSVPCGSTLRSNASWVSSLAMSEGIDPQGRAKREVSAKIGVNKATSVRTAVITVGTLSYILTQQGAGRSTGK